MSPLTRRKLIKTIDTKQVRQAIVQAETETSGEIRVSVSRFFWGDVQAVADRAFVRMEMTATKKRNAILFFLVPSRRRFAVIGDKGIHEKVGDEFWKSLAEVMSDSFRKGDFTTGLIAGIIQAGKQLAAHFPYDPKTDVNELTDEIDFHK